MLDYLRHIAVFSRVAEHGSFTKAAKSLGIAPSRVSESVAKLESHIGLTLINRTTRKIALTSEGRRLYDDTAGLMDGAEHSIKALQGTEMQAQGSLRISLPTYLSSTSITQAIGRFVALNPQVHIEAHLSDRPFDPIEDGYDMCVRAGHFDKRKVKSQELDVFERAICVGKGYLDEHLPLAHPQDLTGWDWINYRHRKRSYELTSRSGKTTRLSIEDEARLQVDNIEALYSFACMGAGVAVMPLALVERGVRDGKLVRLFEDWTLPQVRYSAIWNDNSRRQSLVQILVSFLADHLSTRQT